MMMPPIRRVLAPQLVVAQYFRCPSASRYWISKLLAKFVPRLWLVPACKTLANNGLARRANSKWLFKFLTASTCHPGQFWSESLYMLSFFLDKTTRNEQREVGIEYTGFFEAGIHESLNILPDGITIRPDD